MATRVGMKRMAPPEPPERQPPAPEQPVAMDRLPGVLRAAGGEATAIPREKSCEQGREQDLIGPQEQERQDHHGLLDDLHGDLGPGPELGPGGRRRPARLQMSTTSRCTRAKLAAAALGRATITSSRPAQSASLFWRKDSRIRRLTRFLTTALPTRLETVTPRRTGCRSACSTRKAKRFAVVNFRPVPCMRTKSARLRILSPLGSVQEMMTTSWRS